MKQKNTDLNLLDLVRDESAEAESFEDVYARKLIPREIDINVQYNAPDGKAYSWKLRSQILSGNSRVTVGRAAATMIGGVPWESVPPSTQSTAYMLAWVAKAIVNLGELKTFEKWVQEDAGLLMAVYEEVQAHEARYFHRNSEEGDGDSPKPTISITSVASSQTQTNGVKSTGMGS